MEWRHTEEKDILIVDDELGVRELIKAVIQLMGLTYREATDGVEALDQIANEPPSLVILDLMMPEMDGIEVLKRLKADPKTAKLPILVFTAYNLPEDQLKDINLKPSLVIQKGNLSIRELRDAVEQALSAAA